MGLVFGQTETLLLPSVSATLSKFLCYPDSELSEKLKFETRVKISHQNTDSGVNYLFLGSFVDIIRANEIINTFIQQLSKYINDSLCETSTLVLDLNEKQKSLLVPCVMQNAGSDPGHFNGQEPGLNSNTCLQEVNISKNGTKIKTATVDRKEENAETNTKENIIALTDTCTDTNILSDFVSSKENQRKVNNEENAFASAQYKHVLHENTSSFSAQNAIVKVDFESPGLGEKDHDEKLLIKIPGFESDKDSERNKGSSEKEIVQSSDIDNENVNDYSFTDDDTREENNLSNQGIKKIQRKRKDQHTCKVDFDDDHPDFNQGTCTLPDEIKDVKYEDDEEPVFTMHRNAGRLTRDKNNREMAKSECRFCPFVNFSVYARAKRQLQQHYCRNHAYAEPVHKCEQCSESFCTTAQLYDHKSSKHIFINCEICGTAIRKSNYLRHSRIHEDGSDTLKLEDDKCKKKLTPKLHVSLQQPKKNTIHISVEEKGSFNCEICKTFWLDKTSLDLHIKFKHGKGKLQTIQERNVRCDQEIMIIVHSRHIPIKSMTDSG
ncbi:unnamed protein product [Mytilus coruscus]|uniref:C2H2-type domain-containing protein n=1 Tax=Mytilus coruscus TaxID=42192 RepID=A0A6J8AB29_MYTCO|nr:unnamed protein product [Mytilus coruscus]